MEGLRAVWRNRYNYLFVLPAVLLFAVFTVYPIIKTLQLSVYRWDGVSRPVYIGFANFADVWQDAAWWQSFVNGGYFTLFAVVGMVPLALVLALAVWARLPGAGFFRAVFYFPVMLSQVVVGFIWKWIYDPYSGILNAFLSWLGLAPLARAWLSDPYTALPAVSVASIWQGFGGAFILLLAGLQGIPRELYEAAEVDGANGWKRFRFVTMPLLVPVLAIVTVLTVLGAMQLLGIVMVMTNGGPGLYTEVPALRIYKEAIQFYRLGYASAEALFFAVILMVMSFAQLWLSRRLEGK